MTPPPAIPRHNITLVGPGHPYRGGIAQFTEAMYRGLQDRGHETSLLTFTRQYPERLFPGKTQYETEPVTDPVPAQRILDTLGPLSWFRTARRIGELGADTVLLKYWMPFFAPSLGTVARRVRRKGTRVLALAHNALPHERRPGDVALTKFFFRSCDGIVVMSKAVEQDLRRLGIEAPVRYVAHPVIEVFGDPMPQDRARNELGLDLGEPVLLFFGFIRNYKGLQVLLEAMPALLKRVPRARLLVAGEFYADPAPYLEQIRRHGLEDSIELHTEYIPNDRVPLFFSAADVVVQPYVSATQSGVAQIAYHFDKPAIVTDVGGLAEIVLHEETGLVVPPRDPSALAEAMARFFEENMAESLTAGARREKRKYSWDRLFEAVEELMNV